MKQLILDALPKNTYLKLKRWRYKRSYPIRFEAFQAMRLNASEQGYSFKGFDEKKVIFVHIPKCAGVSVNQTLFGNLGGGHHTLEDYLNIFEPRCINEYFKFTIVRNPWDRLVSAYFFLKKGGFDDKDKNWFEKELSAYSDFDEFVRGWLNKQNIWKWHHFRPQYHYIVDEKGKVPLDFIGYIENIEDDFNYIMKKVNLSPELAATNVSQHNSYQNYYNDETKEIVRQVYAEDIALLGYNFDNSNLPEMLAKRQLE